MYIRSIISLWHGSRCPKDEVVGKHRARHYKQGAIRINLFATKMH